MPAFTDRPRTTMRVFAMARPRRPQSEADAVAAGIAELGASGSRRECAKALAVQVADLAVAQLGLDDFGAQLAQLSVMIERPSIAALAFGPDSIAATATSDLALAAFSARGCRHADQHERGAIDAKVRAAVIARLAERYRRALK